MIERVEMIEAGTLREFEKEINNVITGRDVRDIKFCINPNIETGYSGTLVGGGGTYCAMVIYEK